ncbi:MAG: diguanylate cyclase [Pedobacter sp.]
MVVLACSGFIYIYCSSRLLVATQLFMETTLPKIETANDLQSTAQGVDNYVKSLIRNNTVEEIEQNFRQLNGLLDRLENLTAKISQQERDADILTLNWLSQAIRTQVQLVVQLEMQKLGLEEESRHKSLEIQATLASLPAFDIILPREPPDTTGQYDPIYKQIQELILLFGRLEEVRTLQDIEELQDVFEKIRRRLLDREHGQERDAADPRLKALRICCANLEKLFSQKRQYLQVNDKIPGFIDDLSDSVGQLTLLTSNHVKAVFAKFYQHANRLIQKGKHILYLTISLVIGILPVFYMLYRRIVIQGFGNRLSLISNAMVTESNGEGERDLPLAGHDEIAEMARAAEVLLDKAMRLKNLATKDELTQVYNRRYFFDIAQKEVLRAARKKTVAVVAMLDIDHFKSINDNYGHAFGDKVLHDTAQTCSQVMRTIDLFARYGGEEFVLLMPETNMKEAAIVAERIRKTVESIRFITEQGTQVQLTISIGLAETLPEVGTIDKTINQADNALYQAKNLGRNRVEVYRGLDQFG